MSPSLSMALKKKEEKKAKFVFHFRIDPVLRESGLSKQAISLLPRSTGFELLLEVITEKKTHRKSKNNLMRRFIIYLFL